MTPRAIVAIDVGTSAVRAALVDMTGAVLASARTERSSERSGRTFDAVHLWRDVTATTTQLRIDRKQVTVLAISIAAHIGSVLTDDRFVPLCPAGGWADARGIEDLLELDSSVLSALLRRAGRPAATGGLLPLLLQFRRTEPRLFARVRWALSPKDFLVARLSGAASTDVVNAAYSLASAVAPRQWDAATLSSLGIARALFPEQTLATATVGTVTAPAATETGLPEGTPVLSGGPDGTIGATAVLGGAIGTSIADIAGTTDVLVKTIGEPSLAAESAVLNPYAEAEVWTTGGPTGSTGGGLSQWSRMLGFRSVADALKDHGAQVAAIEPGASGLFVQTNLSGSRFPLWAPEQRGQLVGLEDRHTTAHVLKAAIEGTAFIVRLAVDTLDPQRRLPVALAGGIARSPLMAQIRADVMGREVILSPEPDVSLMGASLIGMVAVDALPTLAEAQVAIVPKGKVVTPNVTASKKYNGLLDQWRAAVSQPLHQSLGA